MKSLHTLVLIMAIATLVSLSGLIIVTTRVAKDKKNMVTAICNWSRNGDTSSEKSLCGIVEAQTHTEFLCRDDFNCWTELK